MKFTETKLKGCFIIEFQPFEDSRGYFFESYRSDLFKMHTGEDLNFVQDNESQSKFGVIRGLHIQKGSYAQSKLIKVLSGKIYDVAVDVREGSPTYGRHIGVELSAANKKQLYIPKGFLHGFSVLSDEAVVYYKCDAYYNRESEDGVYPLDEELDIDWKLPAERIILSDKDKNALAFQDFIPCTP